MVCPSVCLSVCLSCLSVSGLLVCLSVGRSVCRSRIMVCLHRDGPKNTQVLVSRDSRVRGFLRFQFLIPIAHLTCFSCAFLLVFACALVYISKSTQVLPHSSTYYPVPRATKYYPVQPCTTNQVLARTDGYTMYRHATEYYTCYHLLWH